MLIPAKRSSKYPAMRVAVDTETTGLNTWIGARPYIVSWCWFDKKETTGLVHWKVDPFTRAVTIDPKDIKMLKGFLENPDIVKVFHNAKFDLRMLESIGITIKGRIEDTQFKLRCLHNDLPTYGLKPTCARILNIPEDDLKELKKVCSEERRQGKKLGWSVSDDIEPDYWMVADVKYVHKYAIMDVIRTKRLDEWLEEQYDGDNQRDIYEKELRLLPVTYEMERRGVSLNPTTLDEEIAYHRKNAKKQFEEFLRLGGVKDINIRSNKQLVELFYTKMKFPITHRTDKGSPSVNIEALKKIQHPIAYALSSHNASEHALANFFDVYKRESERRTPSRWVLHPDFQQMGARTGRFSCRHPNLQNVANNAEHKAIVPIQARRPFSPAPGYTWFACDYSQMEVWVFAAVSGERMMLDALTAGRDIHGEVANHVWGNGRDIVAEELKTSKEGKSKTRILAKLMLFGIIYGMGPSAAMDLVKCDYKQATKYLEDFKKSFPMISEFMKSFSRKAESQGYVENIYGRRYFIEKEFSYRAVNYLVQGSCADLLKNKMIETTDFFRRKKIDGGIIMTIHDELVFEIANRFITKNLLIDIKDIMEDHHNILQSIPKLKLEISKITSAGSWSEKEKLKL